MTSFTSSIGDLGFPEQQSATAGKLSDRSSTVHESGDVHVGPEPYVTGDELAGVEEQAFAGPRRGRAGGGGRIDPSLIQKAKDIVESIDSRDAFQTPLHVTSLAGVVMEMWESAADSSDIHQDILATLENAVRLRGEEAAVTNEDLSAFREALTDLTQEHLAQENADVIRSRFVRMGFGPLAFAEEDSDNTGDAND